MMMAAAANTVTEVDRSCTGKLTGATHFACTSGPCYGTETMSLKPFFAVTLTFLVMTIQSTVALADTVDSPTEDDISVTWEPIETGPASGDVYVDMKGDIIPLDSNGLPLDNPEGYGSTPDDAPDANPATGEAAPDSGQLGIGPCTPGSELDNPHRSSTGVTASGHGWWKQGTCKNDRAKVYNCLYRYWTSNKLWHQQACSDVKTLKPGGGSTHRTVARKDCKSTTSKMWRNHVDVDVVNEWDTAEKPMRQATIKCHT